MIKKILFSVASIAAVAGLAFGATQAFFSDTEKSEGNTLIAGALDLKVDNACYYNGQACKPALDPNGKPLGYSTWNGDPKAEKCSCTWQLKDLERGDVFFDLRDLKPGDWEEDTISLHVFNNDAWACVDLDVKENSDNGCNDPEKEDEPDCGEDDKGELAEELNFFFWHDDGDNIFEERERPLTAGPASDVLGGVRWALSDSQNPVIEEGPLKGSHDYFIGKAFCYGKLTPDPLTQDGVNTGSPANDNDGDLDVDSKDGGFGCDGSEVDNASQTDKLTGDVVFEAVQSRHNPDFLCNPPEPTATPTPTELPEPTPTEIPT